MWQHEREALPSAQTGHIDNPPWGDLTGTGSPPPGPLGQIALLGDGVASTAPAWRVNRHTCLKFSITGRQTSPPPRSPIISFPLLYACVPLHPDPDGPLWELAVSCCKGWGSGRGGGESVTALASWGLLLGTFPRDAELARPPRLAGASRT